MIRPILTYPNPLLRQKSRPVNTFDASLKQLAQDMLETMYSAQGIGLAAIQIGEPLQLIVVDTRPRENQKRYELPELTPLEKNISQPLILANPQILDKSGETTFEEGCLSVPGFYETVKRYQTIRLQYQDLEGHTQELVTDGLLAIVIQHEMDHLEGLLFLDRISFVQAQKIKESIAKHGYPMRKTPSRQQETPKKMPTPKLD